MNAREKLIASLLATGEEYENPFEDREEIILPERIYPDEEDELSEGKIEEEK